VSVTTTRYAPRNRSFETQPPPEFHFEVVVVSGEEGRELRLEQARAIRALLLWAKSQGKESGGGRKDEG
jgi:hypothetical protein